MTTRPEELLSAARKQCLGSAEADWRSAAGTCYYAAFHALKTWHATVLPRPGDVGQANGEHEQLIHQLLSPSKKCTDRQMQLSRLLGRELDTLRGYRVIADYRLEATVTQVWAETAILCAEGIFDEIESYARK